jgi:hypothetical protein
MTQATGGIYVDDAGTPGVQSPSDFLHADRKSWAAVIVPDSAAAQVATALDIFLAGFGAEFGARELHFTDIYSGRFAFDGVAIEKRYELIDLMATIFAKFQLPILFQTCSPEFMSEIRQMSRFDFSVGPLNLNKHDHLSLLYLLFQVRCFMTEHSQHFKRALPVIVDEGLAKAGAAIDVPTWSDLIQGGRIEFHRSHESPFLQLADFAAFAIARTQWLAAKGNLKGRDLQFLRIVSAERLCMINLPLVNMSAEDLGPAKYDEILRRDRRSKGLPDDLPSSPRRH